MKVSNCCGSRVIDPGNTGEGICSDCKEHCGYLPECEPTFYLPFKSTTPRYGKYDSPVDIVERGLDGECGEDQNGEVIKGQGHQWLVIPTQKGQKTYLLCLRCGERSHL